MENINFSRQGELINYEFFENTSISIIGAGATGSFLGLALSKIGYAFNGKYGELKIFDNDVVGAHNLSNQYFFPNQTGKSKVESLKENLEVFNCSPTIFNKRVKSEDMDSISEVNANIIVLAVDDNDARRDIMEDIIPYCTKCIMVIDPGMSLTGVKTKCFYTADDWDKIMENWLKSWIPKRKQPLSPCGTSMTAFPTVLGVVHYTMNAIICFYRKFWASAEVREKLRFGNPIAEVDVECYNHKGYFRRSWDSPLQLLR